MTDKMCWICTSEKADSGEHIIIKSILDKVFGDLNTGEKRYLGNTNGNRNTPIKSHKRNNHLKFNNSICGNCNSSLTQEHDKSFALFIDKIFKSEQSIIRREVIDLDTMTDNNTSTKTGVELYFLKIFGCLLIENNITINETVFNNIRHSIFKNKTLTRKVNVSFHRNLKKLELFGRNYVAQFSSFTESNIIWTIDISWLSINITYPIPVSEKEFGQNWILGKDQKMIKLGRLIK